MKDIGTFMGPTTCVSDSSIVDLNSMDSRQDPEFDIFIRLAMRALDVPMALVSNFDTHTDRLIFQNQQGMPDTFNENGETLLAHSLCRHVRSRAKPYVMRNDKNCLVDDENPAILAYIGVPVHGPDNSIWGAFSVMDHKPRDWGDHEQHILEDLAQCLADKVTSKSDLKNVSDRLHALEKQQSQLGPSGPVRDDILAAFITSNGTVEDRYEALLNIGKQALGCENGVIARLKGDAAELIFGKNAADTNTRPALFSLENSIFATVVTTREIASQTDHIAAPGQAVCNMFNDHPASFIAAPLIINGQVDGILEFSSNRPKSGAWTRDDIATLSLMALLVAGHLDLHGQIASLKQSETALIGQLLAARAM